MSQEKDLVDIDLNFEYLPGVSFNDATDRFQETVLEYKMYFETMDWTKDELEYISQQLVETAKIFAQNQGLGQSMTNPVTGVNGGQFSIINYRGRTGNLINSIKAIPRGNQIDFFNDATNFRGQAYAGHIEYGFHARDGKFVPARPFMRPAMQAVAAGSRGNFQQIMKSLLDNLWTRNGFNGISSMMFGRKAGSGSLFWKQNGSFGSKLSQRTRMGELRGQKHRQHMSANRRVAKEGKSGRGHKGYRFSKVNKDFKPRLGGRTQARRDMTKYDAKKASEKGTKSKQQSSIFSRRTYTLNQRKGYTFYDDGHTNYIAKDGSIHPSYRQAEAYNFKLGYKNDRPQKEYVPKITAEREVTSYTGRFSFKGRK